MKPAPDLTIPMPQLFSPHDNLIQIRNSGAEIDLAIGVKGSDLLRLAAQRGDPEPANQQVTRINETVNPAFGCYKSPPSDVVKQPKDQQYLDAAKCGCGTCECLVEGVDPSNSVSNNTKEGPNVEPVSIGTIDIPAANSL